VKTITYYRKEFKQIHYFMRTFPLGVSIVASAFLAGCGGSDSSSALTNEEVDAFVHQHIESQVGYEAAIEPYLAGLSPESKYFVAGNSEPRNANLENVDASWFYEDSLTVDVFDIQLYGSAASVMGMIHFHNLGQVDHRSFHGTVVRDGDRLRWDRWYHADHGKLARKFVPNESEVEGAVSLCNSMLWMSLQGDGEEAGAISDSLIAMDPDMALAHVGALWRAWFNNDSEEWNSNVDEALEKSNDPATKYYFMSHSDRYGDQLENARIAHSLASDSPLTQVNYAWQLMGEDDEAARIILNQATSRWTSLGGPHNLLGYLNMREGDMEAAEQSFKLYVRLAPDVANAHDSMGDFYVKQGDKESARACFEKAIELNPAFEASRKKLAELDA